MTSVVVEGTVERLVYASAETGYSVVRLCDRQGAPVTVVGVLPGVNAGQTLRVAGRWVQHPAYGPQLVAERIRLLLRYVKPEKLWISSDCGFSQTARWLAVEKMKAMVKGAAIVRKELMG